MSVYGRIHLALCSIQNGIALIALTFSLALDFHLRFITISTQITINFKSNPNRLARIQIESSSSQIKSS